MVPVNNWTMTTRGSNRVSVTGLGDKRDTFFRNNCPFLNWLYTSKVDFVLLQKKDTTKSTIAMRVGQFTPMCDPKATRTCCTKPNWIGSPRLWNNRPRPHSMGLLGHIVAHENNSQEDIFAGRDFREKIFSREVIFAGRYFRGKIFSREQYIRENNFSRKYFKFSFRENFLPRK